MRNFLLGGIAVASALTFMVQSAPASAQAGCGGGHPCTSNRTAGAGPAQFRNQHHSYGNGYGRGYGVGVGAAALATGVIIGGAMQQSQGYYPVQQDQGYYPAQQYQGYYTAPQNQGYYPAESYPIYSDQSPAYDEVGPQVVNDGDSTAYCQQTYRSYDIASGTYLGYDGLRHPCP